MTRELSSRCFERLPLETGKPTCVVAHTVKGKGVSFMEDRAPLALPSATRGAHGSGARGDRSTAVRNAFLNELHELAREDPRIVFITGDLGFGVVEQFREELPDQFVNAGVAEQNMTGIAAGMALSGKIVFTYSIANFPTLRCLEHIRNDVCYHDADVKVVSVGGGFAYGSMGATHHATEDLGVMRLLPNMIVVAPGDPVEARAATRAVVAQSGPCYLRLGKAGETGRSRLGRSSSSSGRPSSCVRGRTRLSSRRVGCSRWRCGPPRPSRREA